uniref:Uncharacterized protein n=1 Tax=Anguilla anguilla TaxID=7936 RepID=A0A0E9US27_ANGAN
MRAKYFYESLHPKHVLLFLRFPKMLNTVL